MIGAAIALNLLFGLPLIWGVCLTALDVLVVLFLQHRGFRYVEALVVALIVADRRLVRRRALAGAAGRSARVAAGLHPAHARSCATRDMLYIAIGILGATVMPHNLYLHSSIVQTRKYVDTHESKREAIRFATIDSTVALMFALFINAAILIMAAATFHGTRHEDVADIGDAYKLLSPLLGTTMASTLFAVALLCSGQNATLTGTLAGQIVMEGFINLRLRPWLRRLITRLIAIVPAVIVDRALRRARHRAAADPQPGGPQPAAAVRGVPAGDVHRATAHKMGAFVNAAVGASCWPGPVAVIIAALNVWLLYQTFTGL